jgi:ribose transport system permease protein
MTNWSSRLVHNHGRSLVAGVILVLLMGYFLSIHPRGPTIAVTTAWANQCVPLALLAVGQTIVVYSRGIDLSIGPVMALTNCVASVLMNGSPADVAFGIVVVLLVGVVCGLVNGLVVVVGNMQPIIATLATGAVFSGVALIVQPIPGGSISEGLADLFTRNILGLVPTSLVAMLVIVGLVWGISTRTLVGRSIIAVGSSENSAYMSGLPVDRAKLTAYALSGLFAAFGSLFLGFQTLSGDPGVGLPYTLNSIAAVVIGGTALGGGTGSVLGSIAGASILRTIGSLIFFIGLPPLAQPLFEGLVLVLAVSFGVTRILNVRNRMEVFR